MNARLAALVLVNGLHTSEIGRALG
jgi:hypothetical protein